MITLNQVAMPELKSLMIDDSFIKCMDAPNAVERFVQLDKDLIDLKTRLKSMENEIEVDGEELKSRNRKVSFSILLVLMVIDEGGAYGDAHMPNWPHRHRTLALESTLSGLWRTPLGRQPFCPYFLHSGGRGRNFPLRRIQGCDVHGLLVEYGGSPGSPSASDSGCQ